MVRKQDTVSQKRERGADFGPPSQAFVVYAVAASAGRCQGAHRKSGVVIRLTYACPAESYLLQLAYSLLTPLQEELQAPQSTIFEFLHSVPSGDFSRRRCLFFKQSEGRLVAFRLTRRAVVRAACAASFPPLFWAGGHPWRRLPSPRGFARVPRRGERLSPPFAYCANHLYYHQHNGEATITLFIFINIVAEEL
jgi:hypothetical protein